MASKGQLRKASEFVKQVKVAGSIHKFDLMDKISISIPTYNQLKPYVEHRYGQYVEYNPKTKMWKAKKVTEISEGSKEFVLKESN